MFMKFEGPQKGVCVGGGGGSVLVWECYCNMLVSVTRNARTARVLDQHVVHSTLSVALF